MHWRVSKNGCISRPEHHPFGEIKDYTVSPHATLSLYSAPGEGVYKGKINSSVVLQVGIAVEWRADQLSPFPQSDLGVWALYQGGLTLSLPCGPDHATQTDFLAGGNMRFRRCPPSRLSDANGPSPVA
jgi:hypothetical protein